ncbi:MAG TPA: response regulator [Herpetosiphonaceae bacterium]
MPAIDPRKATVLVVEDNHHNLFLFELLLIEDVGVRYYQGLASGAELFATIRNHPLMRIDLILLDLRLRGDDGLTICRKLRDDPRFAATTIVATTADVTPATAEAVREAGFDGFIAKPINRHRFPDQIRQLCAGRTVWDAGH